MATIDWNVQFWKPPSDSLPKKQREVPGKDSIASSAISSQTQAAPLLNKAERNQQPDCTILATQYKGRKFEAQREHGEARAQGYNHESTHVVDMADNNLPSFKKTLGPLIWTEIAATRGLNTQGMPFHLNNSLPLITILGTRKDNKKNIYDPKGGMFPAFEHEENSNDDDNDNYGECRQRGEKRPHQVMLNSSNICYSTSNGQSVHTDRDEENRRPTTRQRRSLVSLDLLPTPPENSPTYCLREPHSTTPSSTAYTEANKPSALANH